ncbi:MAG: serine/threonine protein kinase [Acidobacteria bacterium]|nr:serine/threonine protein kinase [Acidobacteriota bacterium]
MNPVRWKQVTDLFHEALGKDPAVRETFLSERTGVDAELLGEVRSLLAAHERGEDFLETPAWGVAPELMFEDDGATLSGRTIGPYRILDEVGRGGMGVVYAAEDTRLGREVALKALAPHYTQDPARRMRLRREARAAASLSHHAIATVFALEEIDGELYIASELVRGHTLREELGSGPLPAERLRSTLIDIADALAAAHARGIVHRDMKPENVIRGIDGQVKVLDFGLARFAGRESDPDITHHAQLTETGAVLGTPGYMAPEQLSGGVIDARTDVFAFGVLAAELATGEHPFGSNSPTAVARTSAVREEWTGISTRVWAAPEIEAIAKQCLHVLPEERYRSASELVSALRSALPKASVARGPGQDATWWWRFHQGAISVVLAVLPAVAWGIRSMMGRPYGAWLFFSSLALAVITVTIRLNLLFTAQVNPGMLAHHRRRVFPMLPVIDTALALSMLCAAARLAWTGAPDEIAGLCLGLGIVTVASVTVIEPATTRAARIET